MKRAFVIVCCIVHGLAPCRAADDTPNPEVRERPMSADEAAIRQVSEDWIRFYNAGGAAKVAALYTDDL